VCEDRGMHTHTDGRTCMRHSDTEGRCVRTEICTHAQTDGHVRDIVTLKGGV